MTWWQFLTSPDKLIWSIAEIIKTATIIIGAVVGYRQLKSWQHETLGKQRIDTASKVMREIYNVRNSIAVARRSWRMEFCTASQLANQNTVAALLQKTEAELTYWRRHVDLLEVDGLRLRNETALATAIWGKSLDVRVDTLKALVDTWQEAVSKRINVITEFNATRQLATLNEMDCILISELIYDRIDIPWNLEQKAKAKDASKNYFELLAASCDDVGLLLKPHIIDLQ